MINKSAISCIIFVIAAGLGCRSPEELPEPMTENETDPARFGEFYPFQYSTFMRTKEMEETKYGGSYNYSYVERFPQLVRIFGGIGYGLDYYRARGHYWAYKDMLLTERSPKYVTCLTCKSADAPRLIREMGDKYYTTLLADLIDIGEESKILEENPYSGEFKSMSCSDCHHPITMNLRITRPALIEALERRGTDITTLTRNDMRSLVCAQCHVEYYFHPDPDDRRVIFPWDEGFDPGDMERYWNYRFRDRDIFSETGFFDYIHPDAGVPLRIIQHPEFEMFQGSTHQMAGVSCVDCHMPTVMSESGRREISHHITSPLKYIEGTCQQCHHQSAEWLKERVYTVQERTLRMRELAENAMLNALDALESAAKSGQSDRELLEEARRLYTGAHLRWQYVKAENSIGWHNPQKALETLGESIDMAHRAREKATMALDRLVER